MGGVHGRRLGAGLRAEFTGGDYGRCVRAEITGGVYGRRLRAEFMGGVYGRGLRATFWGSLGGQGLDFLNSPNHEHVQRQVLSKPSALLEYYHEDYR